jgi:hypothetical protein
MWTAPLTRPERLIISLPVEIILLRLAFGSSPWLIVLAAMAVPLWMAAVWCGACIAWSRLHRSAQFPVWRAD